jgi:hypothetical protein
MLDTTSVDAIAKHCLTAARAPLPRAIEHVLNACESPSRDDLLAAFVKRCNHVCRCLARYTSCTSKVLGANQRVTTSLARIGHAVHARNAWSQRCVLSEGQRAAASSCLSPVSVDDAHMTQSASTQGLSCAFCFLSTGSVALGNTRTEVPV